MSVQSINQLSKLLLKNIMNNDDYLRRNNVHLAIYQLREVRRSRAGKNLKRLVHSINQLSKR